MCKLGYSILVYISILCSVAGDCILLYIAFLRVIASAVLTVGKVNSAKKVCHMPYMHHLY